MKRRRILLTRSDEDCAEWAEELERFGLEAVALPCIATEAFDSPALGAALREEAPHADWLVFTSRRGVEAFAQLAGAAAAAERKVAVVGNATADAAMRLVGRVDLVGEGGTAAGLAQTMIDRISARTAPRILLAVAENARDTLEHELTAAGMLCKRFDVYRTVPAPAREPKTKLAALRVDAVFLASPSAVTGFVNQVEVDGSAALVTIGPSTSEAARSLGLAVAAEAREPSVHGLVEALP